MMLKDLRILCREKGVSPAGSKNTLVDRLWEAQQNKEIEPVMIKKKSSAGKAISSTNNYARSEGQNVGNFISDRP